MFLSARDRASETQATGSTEARQPKPFLKPADALTAIRIPLAAAFLLADDAVVRLVVLGVAAASDLADGMWARRVGGSKVGAVLDPVCDKLFAAAAFIVVWRSDVLSGIEIVGVLIRDLTALVAFLITVILRRPTTFPARAGGKAVTIGQFLTLLAFLADSDLVRPFAWATAALSLYAIFDYSREAYRRGH